MMRVAPAPEPPDFEEKVRRPGLRAIAELVGETPDPPRSGGAGAEGEIRRRAEETLRRLRLNDEICRGVRQEYAEDYLEGAISLPYLERRAPFIARELRRQGKLLPGD